MGGFRDVVDTLMPSGAIVDAQRPLYDSRYSSDDGRGAIKLYVPPGIHSMNGAEALAYTRSRHSSSDFDRSARQMRLITALRDQVDIPSLVGDIGQLQQIIKQDIKTDIPPADMSRLASLVQGIDLDKRISLQLAPPFSTQCKAVPSHPLCQVAHNAPYGYVPDIAAIQRAVKNVFSTDPKTIERQQALASEAAVVHVLNGTKGDQPANHQRLGPAGAGRPRQLRAARERRQGRPDGLSGHRDHRLQRRRRRHARDDQAPGGCCSGSRSPPPTTPARWPTSWSWWASPRPGSSPGRASRLRCAVDRAADTEAPGGT